LNTFYGNGAATSKASPSTPNSNNFGLGLLGVSQYNLVENNKMAGNMNGVYLGGGGNVIGNTIRHNVILGNPSAEALREFGVSIGADIQDKAAGGANIFEDNSCLTYAGSLDPEHAPCPSVSERDNDEDQGGEDMAANRVAMPFQGAFQYTNVRRRRLTIPRARLVEAIFRPGTRPLPKAVGLAIPRLAGDPDSVTVTGKVVDAACYMLHVAAATDVSHMHCGAACLARGVPLAIATDDGVLYFPADGNQRLKTLLNARVTASGTVVEKHDSMELKMPVGDKNQMVVRLEGGYKQITIQTLEKISPGKHRPA
jgi:hypothetical protein